MKTVIENQRHIQKSLFDQIQKYKFICFFLSAAHESAPGDLVHVALLGGVNELGHGLHRLAWSPPLVGFGRGQENVTLREEL